MTFRWGSLLAVVLFAAPVAYAGESPSSPAGTRFFALAGQGWLNEEVGKFQPGRGWISNETFYERPDQGALFSLFGLTGKLAEVRTVNAARLPTVGVPWDWAVPISSWDWSNQQQSLAIAGSWPAPARVAQPVPLTDAHAVASAARYLKDHHLDVAQPRLTQVFQIDLTGDGQQEVLLTAQSDPRVLRDDAPGTLYSIALLIYSEGGTEKIVPLADYTSFKPGNRRVEDQEGLYGVQPFDQFIAFVDLDGDGREEIVLCRNVRRKSEVDIFSFDGKKLTRVLSSYTIE